MTTDREPQYGSIELKENNVIRTIGEQTVLSILISDIKVIGEYTTDNGPYIDDYFLTIITATDWYEIPMYVDGMYEFLIKLGQAMDADLSSEYVGSTEWKTRIMYPNKFKDKELYQIVDIAPVTLLEKLKHFVGIKKTAREFSSETKRAREI